MTERVFLKPAPGVRIRREDGALWPEAGDWADPLSLYIHRRVADGDLVAADPLAHPAPEAPDKPAKRSAP